MASQRDNTSAFIMLIAGLVVVVFFTDYYTRLGLAEWVFYILPVALCIFTRNPSLPLYVAAIATALLFLGYVISPAGIDIRLAAINRSIGLVTIWVVAFIARQVLVTRAEVQRHSWINQGHGEVSRRALGDLPPAQIASAQLAALAQFLHAEMGALYRLDGDGVVRVASYALEADAPERFRLGESLVGQVARDGQRKVVRDLPGDYLRVRSALGAAPPRLVLVSPLTADGAPYGVVELAFLHEPPDLAASLELLDRIAESMGIALRSALYRERVLELLQETQRQSEELQAQQEELRTSNEELEEHTRALQESRAQLENQQAELEQINAQLESRTNDLERQKEQLLDTQSALKDSARQIERASRYKSEFLANMSHELRTPLNSSLILAQVLGENRTGNLTEEQVNYAKVIQTANQDLLALINDILDLSKIEAGHADIQPEVVTLAEVVERVKDTFGALAARKNLSFDTSIDAGAPATLTTDPRRLEQILRNLLSNALKFTEAGSVTLRVAPQASGMVAFRVEDSGIGIAPDDQALIFEAFHQADGTTSRKYGGTGLGLSISRELARLLGGSIGVESTVGVGSVFTLTVPVALAGTESARTESQREPAAVRPQAAFVPAVSRPAGGDATPRTAEPRAHIDDDRSSRSRERLILVIEDDLKFAQILYGVAHELDLDCIHASSGVEGLKLAQELKPAGILLDVGLPDQSGLAVLERLKRDPRTRHVPVHMLSVEDHTQPALELGAIGYTLKPAARDKLQQVVERLKTKTSDAGAVRSILIVEDDEALRGSIAVLLQASDVVIDVAATGAQALQKLGAKPYDCIVMDLALPDTSGFEILERISGGEKYAAPPVIVYTGRALTPEEEHRLRRYSQSIIVKGARSPERLLDEVTLFLHRVESQLPPDQQKLLRQARQRDAAFEGRTILLAEDDVRNVYALSSVIEPLGATLKIARNGREAVNALTQDDDIDLVLMDIMMPEMDGLTAIKTIRASSAAAVPIIALTAKAMPEDRRACLDAGANDYVAKPIDVDRLLSLCRVWMPK